jgi:hypothetical protein
MLVRPAPDCGSRRGKASCFAAAASRRRTAGRSGALAEGLRKSHFASELAD